MITLAFDTCLAACSVAIVDADRLVACVTEPMTRGHQERLAPMARDLMAGADLSFSTLDRIGVTVGPGSFTGLRVGLAFAKGLALALNRPAVGVGTLAALAASVGAPRYCCAVIDAGRGNIYLQLFESGRAVSEPEILPLELTCARLARSHDLADVTFVGPAAPMLRDALGAARCISLAAPSAEAVARLAAMAPLVAPRPLYLRPPDALPKSKRPSTP